jgi:hypothetical protein
MERSESKRFGSFNFFGLALIFGAIGLVSSFNNPAGMVESMSSSNRIYSGTSLKSASKVPQSDNSCSISDEACLNEQDLPQKVDILQNI